MKNRKQLLIALIPVILCLIFIIILFLSHSRDVKSIYSQHIKSITRQQENLQKYSSEIDEKMNKPEMKVFIQEKKAQIDKHLKKLTADKKALTEDHNDHMRSMTVAWIAVSLVIIGLVFFCSYIFQIMAIKYNFIEKIKTAALLPVILVLLSVISLFFSVVMLFDDKATHAIPLAIIFAASLMGYVFQRKRS